MGEVPLTELLGFLVGMSCGLAVIYMLARLRAQTARGLAEQILANANREAETTQRQAGLAAKEEVLTRAQELEAEIDARAAI